MNDWITTSNGSIVAVNLQYRLGLLGFLASANPDWTSKEGGVYNNGLLDQRMALQWIQRHIAEFGGDPEKVTIVGESSVSLNTLDSNGAMFTSVVMPLIKNSGRSGCCFPHERLWGEAESVPRCGQSEGRKYLFGFIRLIMSASLDSSKYWN